jgi:glutaminyl-tRNA synthetase
VPAEIRLYNQLFAKPDPDAGNFAADLNPQSLEVLPTRGSSRRSRRQFARAMQFERQGYFVRDPDSTPDKPVFNRTIGLRDTELKARLLPPLAPCGRAATISAATCISRASAPPAS